MKKTFILIYISIMCLGFAQASSKTATVRINSDITYQKVTGFGGFVNSPQFGYNHMTTTEIRKLWGKDSETGYNIMRLYIPIGEGSWNQCLSTARLAKELGLIVFASPWSMPANWKTNNNINGTTDGVVGYLKREHYEDYANYLNAFVTYLRNNGVELDAISIQNEPDYTVSYAGCRFSPQEMVTFIKEYGHLIDCKIIAPETVGMPDNYANALLANDVVDKFDIFAGHQYGAIQTAHKQFHAKGKEVWMTEYLINWNDDQATGRNFDWTKDVFNFANAINTCMQADVNAWIHYAAKRYYGMMGDGTNGTTTGVVTKRGYVLSHYAKYSTGYTRIENTWNDDSNVLKGSSFLSTTGDSIVVVVINSSDDAYNLTIDLPFYSLSGKSITTTRSQNMEEAVIVLEEESCRPKVNLNASSISTFVFTKNSERSASQMNGNTVHYNKIDNQVVTNTAFGTLYQLSGKIRTFDTNTPLISSNRTAVNGYLKLNHRYNRLVFEIVSLTSAGQYNSDNTTLHYVNNQGVVASHNYGRIDLNQSGSSVMVFDISDKVLPNGCSGILGVTNSNYSSVLRIRFGDVYFTVDNEKMYKFTGIYSAGDSDMLDCMDDIAVTSIDFTETAEITAEQNWRANASNKNCIYYVGDDIININPNIITGTNCNRLELTDGSGNFYATADFTVTTASYSCNLNGYNILTLPFEANIPEGIKAYTLQPTLTEVICTQIADNRISANTPVLVEGTGSFYFEGSGNVSSPISLTVNDMNIVYISINAPVDSYYLDTVDGVTAFYRTTQGTEKTINPFCAYLNFAMASSSYLPIKITSSNGYPIINISDENLPKFVNVYNIAGILVKQNVARELALDGLEKGVYIVNNQKVIITK